MVHPQRWPGLRAAGATDQARRGARLGPGLHEGAVRALGQRSHRGLADLETAVLRSGDPGLVPGRRGGRGRLRPPHRPRRELAPGRPHLRGPTRIRREPTGGIGRLRR